MLFRKFIIFLIVLNVLLLWSDGSEPVETLTALPSNSSVATDTLSHSSSVLVYGSVLGRRHAVVLSHNKDRLDHAVNVLRSTAAFDGISHFRCEECETESFHPRLDSDLKSVILCLVT